MIEATIRTTEPCTAAFIHMHGDYAQIPDAIRKLYTWAGLHGLRPAGGPSAVYYTVPDETDIASADWEIYAPLARDSKLREEDRKGRGVRHIEPKQVATTLHKGTYDSVEKTYHELEAWVTEHGYHMSGPPEESYLSDPKDTKPEDYVTEIRFPVEKN